MAITSLGFSLVVILLVLACVSPTCVSGAWPQFHAQHGIWLKACPGDMRINVVYDLVIGSRDLLTSFTIKFKITVTQTGGQRTEEWAERALTILISNGGILNEKVKYASTGVARFDTVLQPVDTCSV
ncbi:hypothetical protein HDU93_008912 [Gonapodya sp. JEL0774]|nr:hypothetical protein HDU93_008912 [Gonapodya sp. JEL0774]